MPLHLTSCVPVREPGFSASECLELAAKFDGNTRATFTIVCGRADCCGEICIRGTAPTVRDRSVIVAALRAYADE